MNADKRGSNQTIISVGSTSGRGRFILICFIRVNLRQKLAGFGVVLVRVVEGLVFFKRWELDGNAVAGGFL
jgi:hypothetical protein